MGLSQWISLVSAVVFLIVAVLAAIQTKRSPLAGPLGRTSAALFAYEALEVLKHLTGIEELFAFECAAASLLAPTTAALVIRFLGEWRRLRALVLGGATYFSSIALVCFAAPVVPALATFPGSPLWATLLLGGMLPEFGFLFARLAGHYRTSGTEERARTQLLVLGLVLGVGGASTDLGSIAGLELPRLAAFGLVASAMCLAALSFRYDFLEGVTALAVTNAIAIGAVALLAHLFLLQWIGSRTTLVALLSVAITLAALATLRPVWAALAESRARTQSLVTMGRFSAQMAHDVRNPLAAIRGAAQFLTEERKQGRSIDAQDAFLELIVEQTERLDRVIADYQRLGRAEARREPVDVVALLRGVAEAQGTVSSTHPISVVTSELPADASTASLDRDLVLAALENLVRNAREAAPKGCAIELSAALGSGGHALVLAVRDEGPGMDARTREQALDDFFTTKAQGSGLGLAFVARVAAAHGGEVALESALGRGTTVRLALPLG